MGSLKQKQHRSKLWNSSQNVWMLKHICSKINYLWSKSLARIMKHSIPNANSSVGDPYSGFA